METIITQITEKLKGKILEFFSGDAQSIAQAESELESTVHNYICELLSLYYEKLDDSLLADRCGRKESGLIIERKKDRRQVLSKYGMISFHRTYYAKREGGYCYPIDAVAGLEGYERISLGVATSLCEKVRKYSYQEASNIVTAGAVSKQTVMNHVRLLEKQSEVYQEKKHVPVLHIDADEDHVSLQNGTNTFVPLVSVYEGIDKQHNRHICKNIVHFPFFEAKSDTIWEHVLNWIEENYDITNTKIYVHGDGAEWIQTASEWIPGVTFVLDRYHYNKYKKMILACLESKDRYQYAMKILNAVNTGDKETMIQIWEELLKRNPGREEQLKEAFTYVLNNMAAISIYNKDEEARNGGATEPHVSHVLSERLSMRPLGWSRETLRHIVPFLGSGVFVLKKQTPDILPIVDKKIKKIRPKKPKYTLGLVDPDTAVALPAKSNKVTPLFRLLKSY